jgi:hypothetical protein
VLLVLGLSETEETRSPTRPPGPDNRRLVAPLRSNEFQYQTPLHTLDASGQRPITQIRMPMKIHNTPNTNQNVRQSTTASPMPVKPNPTPTMPSPCL